MVKNHKNRMLTMLYQTEKANTKEKNKSSYH